MNHFKRSQVGNVASMLLLCAAWSAHAQETTNSSAGNSTAPVLGPPALKDFRLEPRERLVTQPSPEPPNPSTPAPQQQPQQQPARVQQPAAQTDRRGAQPRIPRVEENADLRPAPRNETVPPIVAEPLESPPASVAPPGAPEPAEQAAIPPEAGGGSWWPYAILLAGLLGGAFVFLRRRRRLGEDQDQNSQLSRVAAASPAVAAAPVARAAPQSRPWLELELKAQRASFTDNEWVVQFELSVVNTGTVAARNLKIDIMLFNAGKEQDKEIGAFFRTAGRESTKLALPGLQPGVTGIIDGEVAMPLAEMRGMKLNNQTLFIPVVAVNGLYEWDEEGKTGQTAKSYIVGRELQEPNEKMGAFRLDLGPRIWRTVGQRPHKLARRF